MSKITQAFIFAAGRGERMRPFTDETPKPLAQISGKPILQHLIDKVNKVSAINNVVINGHYLADQIEVFVAAQQNPKLQFSYESEKLETGGGLVLAADNGMIDLDKPLLLINGDILWQEDGAVSEIANIFDFYQSSGCDIALGMKKTDQVFGYHGNGDFDIMADGFLQKDPQEEHVHSHVFIGLQVINPKILQQAPSKFFSMSYFYNNHSSLAIDIKGLELQSQFFHIGDVQSLAGVQDLYK